MCCCRLSPQTFYAVIVSMAHMGSGATVWGCWCMFVIVVAAAGHSTSNRRHLGAKIHIQPEQQTPKRTELKYKMTAKKQSAAPKQ